MASSMIGARTNSIPSISAAAPYLAFSTSERRSKTLATPKPEDCLTLGADVGDLSGAEEKAGLDGGGWGSRVGIAEVAQVEDAGDRDEGGLGEGFSDEGGVENSAWREERLVGDGG